MIGIKKNSLEYRNWLRKRNNKNLKIRTIKKCKKKAIDTKIIEQNHKINIDRYLKEKSNEITFVAPEYFSFINNLDETASFFNEIIMFISDKVNFGKIIFIDLSKIIDYTTDALMYLIAVINNLNEHFNGKYRFSGNTPMKSEIKKKFQESGFFKYVHYTGDEPLSSSSDTIKIVTGENSDTEVAKQISDFVAERAKVPISKCRFLYVMMIELMSNTKKHAYNTKNVLTPHWYCFVDYNNDIFTFTFMDIGAGIPSTVRKKFSEKIDILGIKGEDKYVISALNGDFRTSTKKVYRGRGLPKIRQICSENKIKNMRIITNKADVSVNDIDYSSSQMNKRLIGTLYNWQIKTSDLKGV